MSNPGEAKKPNWAMLALLAIIGVLIFQLPALSVRWNELSLDSDARFIRLGYEHARQAGTLHWWVASWINEIAYNYYRPLVSYLHYFQIWLIDTHGFAASTWVMFTVHAVYSVLAGVLAFSLSERRRLAYFVTFIVAAFPLEGDWRWLSEFVLADNLSTMIFQMAALICFAAFLKRGGVLPIIGAWLCFIASVLCKEQGLTTPLLFIVLAVGLPVAPKLKRLAAVHIVFFTAAAYLLFTYARSVTHAKMAVSTPFSNFWLSQVTAGNWWLLALASCIIGGMVLSLRYRSLLDTRTRRMAAMGGMVGACALCMVLAPANGLPRGEFAVVFLADNFSVAINAIPPLLWLGFLAWLFATQHSRALTFTFLLVAAMLPSAALGAPTSGIRFLFLLPFVALVCVYCAARLAERVRDFLATREKSLYGVVVYPGNLPRGQCTIVE